MSTADVARDAAISLRQAIEMRNAKAIELWLDVVHDPAERAYQLARLTSADRLASGRPADRRRRTQTARGGRRPPCRPNHQGPTDAASRRTACRAGSGARRQDPAAISTRPPRRSAHRDADRTGEDAAGNAAVAPRFGRGAYDDRDADRGSDCHRRGGRGADPQSDIRAANGRPRGQLRVRGRARGAAAWRGAVPQPGPRQGRSCRDRSDGGRRRHRRPADRSRGGRAPVCETTARGARGRGRGPPAPRHPHRGPSGRHHPG